MSAAAPWRAPADAEARDRALDPGASFIVQAPAGSGKTTLLVRRFLVLLSQVSQPESIVAITFTRKAAAEMRSRIVTALAQAAAGEGEANEPARAALQRERELGWNLRLNPARLRIQTIDSLCASIVRRMPWMARTGGMPGIVEDARELYREAAQNTLGHVTRGGPAGGAAERLLLHLDNNYRTVRAMFEELLPRRDQWLRHVGVGAGGDELRAVLEESLAEVVRHGLDKVAARIPPLVLARVVELHDFAGRRMDPGRAPVGRVPGPSAGDLPGWRSIADFLLIASDAWRKTADARQGFPPHYKEEKKEFLDIVAALAGDEALLAALAEVRKLPAARFPDEQWRVLEALLTLLPVSVAELKLAFRGRGSVDFVELGEAARAALGTPDRPADLALSLGDRVQHLLIDEFQDTSVSQFELVERLVAGWDEAEARTLFLVGDPMQSIYRFREAEVGLFLRARASGIGAVSCEPLRLTANFRSRPALVDWVNAAFSLVFPQTEDAALGAVTYSESHAARARDVSSAVAVHPFFDPDERSEAETVARLCQEALPGSVAVLVRARSHATGIVAELARRGMPFRAVEFDPLAGRAAIQDLQALTRAMLHPGDRTAWLAVLRAPWCGLSLDELHDLTGGETRAILWERVAAAANSSPRLRRVHAALAEPVARARRVPLRQCVETAWTRLGGPECLGSDADRADSVRYFDLLDEIDTGGETDFGLLERRIGQLFGLPPPAEGPAVELMTVHKAKGLEWDTVIVPGLGREAAGDAKPLLRWTEAPMPDGSARLLLAPIEATREERDDPIFSYLARMERQRSRFETARLLYVAATRARERLHLLGHAEPNAKGEPKPRAGTLLHLLWPVVQERFAAAGVAALPAPTALAPLDQTLRRLPADWEPPAAGSPAPEWHPKETEETEVTFDWAGDTLRHAGSATHRWLERMARSGSTTMPSSAAIRSSLETLGLSGDEATEAAGMVELALTRTLYDARGRWLLSPHAESAAELRVSVVEEGAIHHSSIDRTFVDVDGTRWVVDYKTGAHEGAGLEEFLDRERERYRARMNRYARYFRATESRPIRLALYYPLLAGWREWQPD